MTPAPTQMLMVFGCQLEVIKMKDIVILLAVILSLFASYSAGKCRIKQTRQYSTGETYIDSFDICFKGTGNTLGHCLDTVSLMDKFNENQGND